MNQLFENDLPPLGRYTLKSNEWYTPPEYIQAALTTMGEIDLDPASCKEANKIVKATSYYTKEENGLILPWKGNIWLNPPFGRVSTKATSTSYQKLFVRKLLNEYKQGNVKQAIVLLLGSVCFNHYFYPLWDYPMCFHDGNIKFLRPNGSIDKFGFGTIFVYIGPNIDKFADAFSKFGRVVKALPTPARVENMELWSEV